MHTLTAALSIALTLSGIARAAVSPKEARAIAKEAYVYGVPMVDAWRTMYAFHLDPQNPQYKGPFNTMNNVSRVFTPDDTAVVTPNADTPYSLLDLDLRAEPMVLSVPKIDGHRYFVFQLMDLYTFNFAYVGSRTTGNDGGTYLIAGPGWHGHTPEGVDKVIGAETELVSIIGRTQLFGPDDLDNVKAIQAQYRVEPLSTYLGTPPPPPPPAVQWLKPMPAGEERTSLEFFNQLAFLLQFAEPPHRSEIRLRDSFAKIGIVPGKPFDAAALSPALQDALKQGMVDGQKEIDARRASLRGKTDQLFGSRAFLKNDFVARATGTQVGIGANSREEALYPIYDRDADGRPLDGSKHAYTLRFAKGHFPPVHAFWSLTMYDLPRQLLVKNPIDRYLINSPMLPTLKTDKDGGVTIYIQADSPGADKEANWLPAPHGPFMLTLRYYWPRPELLKGQWKSPPVERNK
jgi:hypothetical protein